MDSQKFDDITRALASGTTRRRVVQRIAGSAIGGALAALGLSRGAAKPADKVGICHFTSSETNPFNFIEVSANAVPAHEAHGDLVSCPGEGFIDPDSCTCVCPLADADCPNLETVDEASCACVCNPEEAVCDPNFELNQDSCTCFCSLEQSDCGEGFTLNSETCTCDCTLTDDQCPNLEVVDVRICSCFCPVESIDCGENRTLDVESCTCIDNPAPQCAGATCQTFTPCDPDGLCVCGSIVPGGGGICVPTLTPCVDLQTCGSDFSCPEGSVCTEESCCGEPKCVPLSLQCETTGASLTTSAASTRDAPVIGDTFGGR